MSLKRLILFSVSTAIGVAVCAQAQTPVQRFSRSAPDKIVSAEPCGECHKSEYAVWQQTAHATGFNTLHRKESAEKIAEALGFRLIKRDSRCLQCHYTSQFKRGQEKAISGVSCESCHGPAADWINVHNDYGGATRETETEAHRNRRIVASKQAGMLRPSEIYDVVANCFDCHVVPNEELVNRGGHSTGSAFELLDRLDKIRHNFLQSYLHGDGTENTERPITHKRVMYVVGRALDLEYSLRGMAKATETGIYSRAMQRRARKANGELIAISERKAIPQISSMLRLYDAARLAPQNENALTTTADQVQMLAKDFIRQHDGTALAALDPLVLGTAPTVVASEIPAENPDRQTTDSNEDDATGRKAPARRIEDTAVDQKPEITSDKKNSVSDVVIGASKTHIRPRSQYQTIGPANCSCHEHSDEQAWWNADPHSFSADPFFEEEAKNVDIARRYGIEPGTMFKGTSLCMDCHGTVVFGREKRDADSGVSCESCHGAASAYKEPHTEGDKALGLDRPGYRKALQLGMVELKDAATRAKRCAECHYITDQRLVSSGHPTGRTFDFAGGNDQIRHWQTRLSKSVLTAVYATELARRGPLPKFTTTVQTGPRKITVKPDTDKIDIASEVSPDPVAAATAGNNETRNASPIKIDLPGLPAATDSLSVEEMILLIKKRLEHLHRLKGRQK